SVDLRHSLERIIDRERRRVRDVATMWADILTDEGLLRGAFTAEAPDVLTERELGWAHSYCVRMCTAALAHRDERRDGRDEAEVREAEGLEHGTGVDGEEEEELARLDV